MEEECVIQKYVDSYEVRTALVKSEPCCTLPNNEYVTSILLN